MQQSWRGESVQSHVITQADSVSLLRYRDIFCDVHLNWKHTRVYKLNKNKEIYIYINTSLCDILMTILSIYFTHQPNRPDKGL